MLSMVNELETTDYSTRQQEWVLEHNSLRTINMDHKDFDKSNNNSYFQLLIQFTIMRADKKIMYKIWLL
jgi:hypothetical protein